MDTKKLEGAFLELAEADTEAALQLVTGMFVGLTLEYMRRRGHDPSGDIRIDSGGKRDITIHKAGSPAGYCSEGSRCVCVCVCVCVEVTLHECELVARTG